MSTLRDHAIGLLAFLLGLALVALAAFVLTVAFAADQVCR